MQRPDHGGCGCRLRSGWPPLARMRACAGAGRGMTSAWSARSRDEEAQRRCRSDLCPYCHDAVTTPIPVASADAPCDSLKKRQQLWSWLHRYDRSVLDQPGPRVTSAKARQHPRPGAIDVDTGAEPGCQADLLVDHATMTASA